MTFKSEWRSTSDPVVKYLVETYDPQRLRTSETTCVVDEDRHALMLSVRTASSDGYGGTAPRFAYVLWRTAAVVRFEAIRIRTNADDGRLHLVWQVRRMQVLEGALQDDEEDLITEALIAVGYAHCQDGVASARVEFSNGEV